jgi:hypothetical protein
VRRDARCLLATKLFNKHPLAILNGTSNPIGLQNEHSLFQRISIHLHYDVKASLCGLVVRVLGCRSGGPGSIPGTTKKKVVGLERGPLSLVSTTEELLDRKVAAPV